jgi:hypothetical protein
MVGFGPFLNIAFSLIFICFCISFTTRRSFQPGWQSQNYLCFGTALMRHLTIVRRIRRMPGRFEDRLSEAVVILTGPTGQLNERFGERLRPVILAHLAKIPLRPVILAHRTKVPLRPVVLAHRTKFPLRPVVLAHRTKVAPVVLAHRTKVSLRPAVLAHRTNVPDLKPT